MYEEMDKRLYAPNEGYICVSVIWFDKQLRACVFYS